MSETDDFEYTLTRRALRQIKAEAWDEAANQMAALTVWSPGAGPYPTVEQAARKIHATNPYRTTDRREVAAEQQEEA